MSAYQTENENEPLRRFNGLLWSMVAPAARVLVGVLCALALCALLFIVVMDGSEHENS